MRNVTIIPINQEESLVIACDNSGAVGLKEQDAVQASYDSVGYYAFRVAVMECMAAGADPLSVVVQNFNGDDAWGDLVNGIKRGMQELELEQIPITGSTESNFSLVQSALGVIVLGKLHKRQNFVSFTQQNMKLAVVGTPLVGEEVLTINSEIAPLLLFKNICCLTDVTVWPVGSKGILYEINQMSTDVPYKLENVKTKVNVLASSGPSTCFLVVYPSEKEDEIRRLAGCHLHSILLC